MSDVSPSAIKTDAELTEAINKASSQSELVELLHEAAIRQGLVQPDNDPNILNPVPLGTAHKLAKTLVINGVKHIVQGDSEQELLANENALMREVFEPVSTSVAPQEKSQNERGQHSSAFEQSWMQATEEFKRDHSDWNAYASGENTKIIGQILVEKNLVDATEKVQALELAYKHARENGLLVLTEEMEMRKRIASATTKEELAEALNLPERQRALMAAQASGLFGRR